LVGAVTGQETGAPWLLLPHGPSRMAVQGTKALETWCRQVTQGYSGVAILNMTTSWRSGLGFCAIIHHFCPELIHFASLDPDDVLGNNELAFSVAEQHLGIPSLLDPQDMVECELLDRLSILTYLAQYYQAFNSQTVQTRVRRLAAVSKSSSSSSDLADSADGSPRTKLPTIGRLNEPCRQCGKPVEIISRLNVCGRILHRTCFRCARCSHQLSLAGYYETETGEYCCDVCPDEEKKETVTLRANKDLASMMSTDSGHSSEEEEEVVEDETVTSGHVEVKPVELERLNGTDANDNDSSGTGDVGDKENIDQALESEVKDFNKDQQGNESENFKTNSDDLNPSIETVAGAVQELDLSYEAVDNNAEFVTASVETNDECIKIETEERKQQEVLNKTNEYPDHDGNNPFGDDDESDEAETKSTVQANLSDIKVIEKETTGQEETSKNPFGSDLDSEDDDGESAKAPLAPSATHQRNTSLNPFGSDLSEEEEPVSSSPSPSVRSATRKKRRAPLPPGVAPTPAPRTSLASPLPTPTHRGGTAKRLKDADNLHRRSQILESIQSSQQTAVLPPAASSIAEDTVSVSSDSASLRSSLAGPNTTSSSQLSVSMFSHMGPDKADEGQWRKKKGPAPARPIPPKRAVKKLARKAINQELTDIEVKQGELERQGVKLEKNIREICAANDAEEGANRDSLGPEAEDLIIQLFDLVNEKNELFRRQTELIYMKKDNRLEEQHADLEYQIRVLMSKTECQRTEEDKKKEDKLITKLVEIVQARNEIVDCLEMDRLRELDEDTAIEDHMSVYAAVKPTASHKKGGLEKILKMRKKKKKDKDSEKDVDTSELVDNLGDPKPEKPKKKSAKKKILSLASKGLASSKQLAFPHKN